MWKSPLCLLLLGPLLPFFLAAPLQPGQPGAPWTEEEVEVAREKVNTNNNAFNNSKNLKPGSFNHQVRAMLDCDKDCWLDHPVARLLAEGELDDYSRPHEEDTSGPRCF